MGGTLRWRTFFTILLVACHCSAQDEPLRRDPFGRQLHAVTIRGQAVDAQGKPVPGAKVYLLSTNRVRPGEAKALLAETVSDAKGAFQFANQLLPVMEAEQGPPAKLAAASYQVFGTAKGFGFTWHRHQQFCPEKRPDKASKKDGQIYYLGEEPTANLKFEPAAIVRGTIISDLGQPLGGVRVQAGYVQSSRTLREQGGWMCKYLGPAGEFEHEDDRFDGIQYLAEDLRSTITDANGKYTLQGLRRDCLYFVGMDYRPDHDLALWTVATTDRQLGGGAQSLGVEGRLDHTFVVPRRLAVRVATSDGMPLAGARVIAHGSRIRHVGNSSVSGADGMAMLFLPPDEYTLVVEPPEDAVLMRTETKLVVEKLPFEQTAKAIIPAAAVAVLEAVEPKSEKPIAGVSFFQENNEGQDRQEIQSQTIFVDHPLTSEEGRLRAIVAPGKRRFGVGNYPPGYEPLPIGNSAVELEAGKSTTIRFQFKAKSIPQQTAPEPANDGLDGVRAKIRVQRQLSRQGTYRIGYYAGIPSGVSPEDFRAVLTQCDVTKVPDLPQLFVQRFSRAALRYADLRIIADNRKLRNDRLDSSEKEGLQKEARVSVFNGQEVVTYDSANLQASIYGERSLHLVHTGELCAWPRFLEAQPNPIPMDRRVDRGQGKVVVTVEYASSQVQAVIDEATGFMFRLSNRNDSTESGHETWQFAPQRQVNGLLLAGLSVEFSYHQGKLGLVQIRRLDDVDLTAPATDAFVVSIPAGTNIVDFRGDRHNPKSGVVSGPVTDVVMRANAISDTSPLLSG